MHSVWELGEIVRALTFPKLCRHINHWQRQTFPQATPESLAEHLLREARELKENPRDQHELADILILAIGLADQLGVDILDILVEKQVINEQRVWGEPDDLGVVEHIRE